MIMCFLRFSQGIKKLLAINFCLILVTFLAAYRIYSARTLHMFFSLAEKEEVVLVKCITM